NWVIQVQVRQSTALDTFAKFNLNLQAYPGIDSAKVWEVPYTDPKSIIGYQALVDGSGNVWFSAPFPGVLWKFVPGSNSYTRFNLQTPTNSSDLGPIAADQRGNIWFVGDSVPPPNAPQTGHGGGGIGKIEMLNVTSQTILNFVPTSPNSTFLTGIAIGSSGDVWFAEHGSNRIGRITAPYTNASITQISLDSINPNAFPWGLTIDQRGNLWFTEHIGNKV